MATGQDMRLFLSLRLCLKFIPA